MKKNICVVFGGVSPEHEVSLMTAHSVLSNIDRTQFEVYPVGITKAGRWLYYDGDAALLEDGSWERSDRAVPAFLSPSAGEGLIILGGGAPTRVKIDCVFPAMHGEGCEDGAMQGLCKLAGIPCVGPGVGASAASMDKDFTKAIVSRLGIRQAVYRLVTRESFLPESADRETILREIEDFLGDYPYFVKPAGTGSSVGVSKVRDRASLIRGLLDALRYDRKVLVEEFFDGREIETAVMGNADPVVSCCGEIIPGDEFYSYDDKYINGVSDARIPADLPRETSDKVRSWAKAIYQALGCAGLSRVDFFVHKRTGEVCFNEINTLPGFTPISMYPKLFIHGGMTYGGIITELIRLACEG